MEYQLWEAVRGKAEESLRHLNGKKGRKRTGYFFLENRASLLYTSPRSGLKNTYSSFISVWQI